MFSYKQNLLIASLWFTILLVGCSSIGTHQYPDVIYNHRQPFLRTAPVIKITFPIIDEKTICKVKILKSGKPVFANFEGKDSFYVRNGNSSIPKNREEQSEYEKLHWK